MSRVLPLLVAICAALASSLGLFTNAPVTPGVPPGTGAAHRMFTTLHGDVVALFDRGVYANDTLFKAGILRGTDAVTLFVAVPLLLIATRLAARGLRGRLFLVGVLAYMAYNAASLAFGVAYNELHLLYIAYVSTSVFALASAARAIDDEELQARMGPRAPRRGVGVFLVLAGMSVLVWLMEIVGGLVAGRAPESLDSYTTEITWVIDLGIIAPLAFASAAGVLRRRAWAWVPGTALLVLNAFIGLVVIAQTVGQRMMGVSITVAQMVAFVVSFAVMSVFAAFFAARVLRAVGHEGDL